MTSHFLITEKPPVLFRKDSQYAQEQLSSIITAGDYEDLSNHTTEAMGKTGLFSIAQVTVSISFLFLFLSSTCLVTKLFCFQAMLMMKGLMGRCLNHEMALDCVRAKAQLVEADLGELKAWRTVQEKKLALSKQVQGELEKQIEVLQLL